MARGVLSWLGSIYDLDTLDTRFTTPSSVPYAVRSNSPTGREDKRDDARSRGEPAPPSRWATPEFILYYVGLVWSIPYMFWVAYTVSRESDPRYHIYEPYLSDGWIPGRKIDISDSQYRLIRNNLPILAVLIIVHPLLRRAWDSVWERVRGRPETTLSKEQAADNRMNQRVTYDFIFALIFLAALHGFSSLKVLAILFINYKLAKTLPRRFVPPATWMFNIVVLLSNDIFKGYRYQNMALALSSEADGPSTLVALGAWLDSHGGLIGRWEVLFNITILRLISFNLDYYWSLNDHSSSSPLEKKQLDPANLSEKDRVSIPASPAHFTYAHLVAYAIYAPLYLAGPIVTFNDYLSQTRHRPATIEPARTVRYAVRFVLVLLCMELVLHFNYIGAISKTSPDWGSYTPGQLTIVSVFQLHIIWLKLLIPWRLFRLWALVDGVDPPENMVRCVTNNYSTLSFWRSWHRSYYRWLLRYIYIPLGGSSFRTAGDVAQSVGTYLMVFTFVALWHDIKIHLIFWSWLIVLFFLPEIAAIKVFPAGRWKSSLTAYRMLCCVGAMGNVVMMMSANLVGFAVGADGLKSILEGIFNDHGGFVFLMGAGAALFGAVQIMFEVREEEKRKGVVLKC
ncbi:MBOAT-domain-containing protein [Schizothecium vesticola]|uniref:MBOAT-domain-containing protein n=1 Tax=Schizothecium vesticola TaxID=314040 RepID=A0AA40KC77_9PEZI|nr:MBOAT-domain-containing protein [Schizothecium vesticola]